MFSHLKLQVITLWWSSQVSVYFVKPNFFRRSPNVLCGDWVYLPFSAVCAAVVAYLKSNFVETKGRSLEDSERELSSVVYSTHIFKE
jgi:hypothetical protein